MDHIMWLMSYDSHQIENISLRIALSGCDSSILSHQGTQEVIQVTLFQVQPRGD